MRRTCMNCSLGDPDLRPQCLKPLEMQIDGARSDGTAARQGNLRVSLTSKQGPHDEKRRTHFADKIIGSDCRPDM